MSLLAPSLDEILQDVPGNIFSKISCSILMIWNMCAILCLPPLEMYIIKMIPGSWTFHSGMNIMPRFPWAHRHISTFHVRVPEHIFSHHRFHFFILFFWVVISQCWNKVSHKIAGMIWIQGFVDVMFWGVPSSVGQVETTHIGHLHNTNPHSWGEP